MSLQPVFKFPDALPAPVARRPSARRPSMYSIRIGLSHVSITTATTAPLIAEHIKKIWDEQHPKPTLGELITTISASPLPSDDKTSVVSLLVQHCLSVPQENQPQFYEEHGLKIASTIFEFVEKQFDETEIASQTLLKCVPFIGEKLRQFSLWHFHSQDPEHKRAHKLLNGAITLGNYQALLDKADLLKQQGLLMDSARHFLAALERATEEKGLDFYARYFGIVYLLNRSKEKDASELLSKFAKEIPLARFYIGQKLQNKKDYTNAIKHFESIPENDFTTQGLLKKHLVKCATRIRNLPQENFALRNELTKIIYTLAEQNHKPSIIILNTLAEAAPLGLLYLGKLLQKNNKEKQASECFSKITMEDKYTFSLLQAHLHP